jgi:hypothetical protein
VKGPKSRNQLNFLRNKLSINDSGTN